MAIAIATISKNSAEVVKVELTEFNGHQLLGMRIWTKETDRPTQKGITVAVGLIPALREALESAEQAARKLGLLNG